MPPSTPDTQTIRPIPIVPIGVPPGPPPDVPDDDLEVPGTGDHGFAISDALAERAGLPWESRPLSQRAIRAWTAGTIAATLCFATVVAVVHSHRDSAAEKTDLSARTARTDVITNADRLPAPPAEATPKEPAPPPVPSTVIPLKSPPKVAASKPNLGVEHRKTPSAVPAKPGATRSLTVHATTRAPTPLNAKAPPPPAQERAGR